MLYWARFLKGLWLFLLFFTYAKLFLWTLFNFGHTFLIDWFLLNFFFRTLSMTCFSPFLGALSLNFLFRYLDFAGFVYRFSIWLTFFFLSHFPNGSRLMSFLYFSIRLANFFLWFSHFACLIQWLRNLFFWAFSSLRIICRLLLNFLNDSLGSWHFLHFILGFDLFFNFNALSWAILDYFFARLFFLSTLCNNFLTWWNFNFRFAFTFNFLLLILTTFLVDRFQLPTLCHQIFIQNCFLLELWFFIIFTW